MQELLDWESLFTKLKLWYWTYSGERQGAYEIGQTWLDSLYRTMDEHQRLMAGREQDLPCMAIWGPSQTGKSTLLEKYLDDYGDSAGHGSALHWPGGVPARFGGDSQTPADAIVLNPYNHGADASGCVCRFRMLNAVRDAKYPIELLRTRNIDIMHALALGYVSECREQQPTITTERFRSILAETRESSTAMKPSDQAASYAALHSVANLLDDLIYADVARYRPLVTEVNVLRREMLDHPQRWSEECITRFAALLFWDGAAPLTALYLKLIRRNGELDAKWGTRRTFCSLETASLLLDIRSYDKLSTDGEESSSRVQSQIRDLGFEIQGDVVVIDRGLSHPLNQDQEGFGLLQGLILELVIPLNGDCLAKHARPLALLLEKADLLDFPGVGRRHSVVAEEQLDLKFLEQKDERSLLTRVLVRGRTASIVATYARNLSIDGFSILSRIRDNPPNPQQIRNGILTWWKFLKPDYKPLGDSRIREPSPLPLNLVLTFCAGLVNQVARSGLRDGLKPVLERIRELGLLADPQVVTHTLCTNYPQFPDGHWHDIEGYPPTPGKLVRKAAHDMLSDPSFQNQFRTDVERKSFQAMIDDGGTDYLLKILSSQSQQSQRVSMLNDLERRLRVSVFKLLHEVAPETTKRDSRAKEDLLAWKQGILDVLEESSSRDVVVSVSETLRRVMTFDGETFERLHRRVTDLPLNEIEAWVDHALKKWISEASATVVSDTQVRFAGVLDYSKLKRNLGHLAETVNIPRVCEWIINTFGDLGANDDTEPVRRYVALYVSNALLWGRPDNLRSRHRSVAEIQEELKFYSDLEPASRRTWRDSPHFRGFIGPFLDRLTQVANGGTSGGRPDLPGDAELMNLIQQYPELQFVQ